MARKKARSGAKNVSGPSKPAVTLSAAAAMDAVKSLLKDAIEMLDANNVDGASSAIELSIEHIDAQLNDDDALIEIEDDVVLPGGLLTGLSMLYNGGQSGANAEPATPIDAVDAALLSAIGSRDAKAAAKISGLPQGDLTRAHDANMSALLAALLARQDH